MRCVLPASVISCRASIRLQPVRRKERSMTVRERGQHWNYPFMVARTMYYCVLEDAENKQEAKDLEAEERLKVGLDRGLRGDAKLLTLLVAGGGSNSRPWGY